tara:strand:+ start:102 stop:299 length:198 start_codon:yes stop_codon:yes gene_type:complete
MAELARLLGILLDACCPRVQEGAHFAWNKAVVATSGGVLVPADSGAATVSALISVPLSADEVQRV